jgi:hypothetical protein
MELAVTDAMWNGHAGTDKWIDPVWTESKIDQNKIASDVASKVNQRHRPKESVESWHKDTLHLLETYRRITSVAYPPAIAVDTLLTRLNFSPGSYAANMVLLCRAATVPAESTMLAEANRAIVSLYPLFATYEHSELANPIFPSRRRTISDGSSSQSPAVRGPSRTFSTYNVRASVHRYARLVHISNSTNKNGVNQEARFPKMKRSTPKQTGQTLLENWQRKSDARYCTFSCFRNILQKIELPTRGRPLPYESPSSGLPQRTKLLFRSMALALQCVPGTGRAVWTLVGTTRMFCPS